MPGSPSNNPSRRIWRVTDDTRTTSLRRHPRRRSRPHRAHVGIRGGSQKAIKPTPRPGHQNGQPGREDDGVQDPDAPTVKARGRGFEPDPEAARPGEHPLPADYLDLATDDERADAVRQAAKSPPFRRDSPLPAGRVDRPRQDPHRLRNPLHPPVLHLHPTPPRRRNPEPTSPLSKHASKTG